MDWHKVPKIVHLGHVICEWFIGDIASDDALKGGQNISDINTAIHYLSALRQIHIYLGESVPAEDVKKRIEVWTAKMNDDSRS